MNRAEQVQILDPNIILVCSTKSNILLASIQSQKRKQVKDRMHTFININIKSFLYIISIYKSTHFYHLDKMLLFFH